MIKQITNTETADSQWRWLYRIAGTAALISAVFIPIQIAVFVANPPPLQGTAADWFALLQNNRLTGLVDLDLLLVADNVLLIPIILALYVTFRRASESVMATSVALAFAGIICYIVTNPAIQMLSLSDQFTAATTDAARALFVAAGQAQLAIWQGTAFQVAYLAGSFAGIAIGFVMLRNPVLGKGAAYMAILGNAVGLGLYVPVVGVYISVFSVLFLEVWYILIGWRLIQLAQGSRQEGQIRQVSPIHA